MTDNEQKKKRFFSVGDIGYITTMGILFLILGIIISTQTQKHIEAELANLPVERQLNGLIDLLKETQNKKAGLEQQLDKLKQQVNVLNKQSNSRGLSNQQFKFLYQIAGLTPVNGEGIIIKLEDQKPEAVSKNNELLNNDGLLHSDDLLKIINELKAAGAKAIAINDQRLVTTSEIITAGNSILVNQSRLIPPYIIKVVGPVDTMFSSLKMRGGIVEYLEVYGFKINIEKKSNLKIPAYNKALISAE